MYKKSVDVLIRLGEGLSIRGQVNINGYDRLSDFMEKDKSNYLKVYNATLRGVSGQELLVNKENIIFIDMAVEKGESDEN